MFKVVSCIQNDHDFWLIGLAGLICIGASIATVTLLRQARDSSGRNRRRWLATAGLTSGFGIWATHFIAMVGYDPGTDSGYELTLTLLSLVVATIGFNFALRSAALADRLVAGGLVGLGIAAMHYIGMMAVTFAGTFAWSLPYVLASLVFAYFPITPALALALDRKDRSSGITAALLIVAAILLLHFTGMAGITVVPGGEAATNALSPISLGISVAAVAVCVLVMGIMSALVSRNAKATIRAHGREFELLVQGISDCAIYMLDGNGSVISWNAGAQRLKGYTEREAIGLELGDFYSIKEHDAGLPSQNLAIAREKGRFSDEGWRYRKDGSRFWAHVSIERVTDHAGVFHGFAKITPDMTKYKIAEDQLLDLSSNLNAALSNMHQGLCLFGSDARLIVANEQVGEIFRLTSEECPAGITFEDFIRVAMQKRSGTAVPPDVVTREIAQHHAFIGRQSGGSLILNFRDDCTLSVAHRPILTGGWVTTFEDITERRRAEARIEYLALHDGLTGLPNRPYYTERLDAEIIRAERADSKVAVVGIDLDRFKEINDMHGHATGDAVLKALAERLQSTTRADELVARFGGDEFAAFKVFSEESDLHDFIKRLEVCLTSDLSLENLMITPSGSLGVAIYPTDGQTRDDVVNNADLAMYRAKATMGRQVCFYEHGMDEAARERRVLASDLREAIERNEFCLVYQVQRSVVTEQITGFEALMRWDHSREGLISPDRFIPIAEENGEIIKIGEWVLRTACAEAVKWPEDWQVAVNLSPVQLMSGGFFDILTRALLDSGLPAKRLELEITETAFVTDKAKALHVLRLVKALGVTIAIDDFGTGYSSLDTLNSFPFDKIKIDKSFLHDSDDNHQSRAIIRAVLALGRALDVPVLAEGLESEQQLKLLRSEGCHEAQGFLWGRPTIRPTPSSTHTLSPDHAA